MAKIKAFRGILYNREKVDIGRVVTPPYDVISPSMQQNFYQRDRHNIVRLILGKEEKGDTSRSNKYTRAGALLGKWLKNGVFKKDRKPSMYVYTQKYLHRGKKRTRIGFIALMKIEDPKQSGILPHEYTLDKPKEDRLNLMRATGANMSPIFTLFHDRENRINKLLKSFAKSGEALLTVEAEGVMHRLWNLTDKKIIRKIETLMRDKKIFIADGHHRYEVALSYRNEMRKKRYVARNSDYVMMYFSNLKEKTNLTILSTHRVVKNIARFDEERILRELQEYFLIRDLATLEGLCSHLEGKKSTGHVFGMYTGGKRFWLLELKNARLAEKLADQGKPRSLRRLGVTILHDAIINRILGVTNNENSVKYVRNAEDAVRLVDNGGYQAAFFLRPTDIMDMKAVAEKGVMMPQKSTYFYPKLLTGLVVNKF